MPKRIRKQIVDHPDFPPVDWKAIARKYEIFWVDTTCINPNNPFGPCKASKTATWRDIPCIHDLPKWEYPTKTAREMAATEYFLLRYERHRKMKRAGLNPKPFFKFDGYKCNAAVKMKQGTMDKYNSWVAKRERAQMFPDQYAEENRKTKSKLIPVG